MKEILVTLKGLSSSLIIVKPKGLPAPSSFHPPSIIFSMYSFVYLFSIIFISLLLLVWGVIYKKCMNKYHNPISTIQSHNTYILVNCQNHYSPYILSLNFEGHLAFNKHGTTFCTTLFMPENNLTRCCAKILRTSPTLSVGE